MSSLLALINSVLHQWLVEKSCQSEGITMNAYAFIFGWTTHIHCTKDCPLWLSVYLTIHFYPLQKSKVNSHNHLTQLLNINFYKYTQIFYTLTYIFGCRQLTMTFKYLFLSPSITLKNKSKETKISQNIAKSLKNITKSSKMEGKLVKKNCKFIWSYWCKNLIIANIIWMRRLYNVIYERTDDISITGIDEV